MRLLLTGLALALMTPVADLRQLTAVHVGAGDDLQKALDSARAGDTILLARGATFRGNFVLPAHEGDADITIRTDAAGLPRPGQRTGPQYAGTLAVLQSPSNMPTLRTAAGARHWRIENLEFAANRGGEGTILALGDSEQRRLEDVPRDLVLDRIYLHGDQANGQRRGIALNSAATRIVNSYVSDLKSVDYEAQAIAGWNGPGPFTIENNYLEAAGENILFGGSDPAIDKLVPSDIVIRRNHLAKVPEWRDAAATKPWTVKNLLELKTGRNVEIDGNTLEYNWVAAQQGYAILIKPVNQDGHAPWSTIENVRVTNNVVRHVSGAININGTDSDHPSARARGIVIRNNLFLDVDGTRWGGSGDFVQIGGGPADVTVEYNTALQTGRVLSLYHGPDAQPIEGFVFRGNIVRHNEYGVKGQGAPTGRATLERFAPGAVFERNVLAGGPADLYPPGNLFPAVAALERAFVNLAGGDLALRDRVDFLTRANGGRRPGVDMAALEQARRTPEEAAWQ